MGYKRKFEGYDNRPSLNPVYQRAARVRKSLAQIGEPSRHPRDLLKQGLLQDLQETHSDTYALVLETLKATVYEQPHKIRFLAEIIENVPEQLAFMCIEMAHEELCRALLNGEYGRVKVFLRFLCALNTVIENVDVLIAALDGFLDRALDTSIDANLRVFFYKSALLAAIYLPKDLVNAELREKFGSVELPSFNKLDVFVRNSPYEQLGVNDILPQVARQLNDKDWDHKILASLVEELEPEPKQEQNEAEPQNGEPQNGEQDPTTKEEKPGNELDQDEIKLGSPDLGPRKHTLRQILLGDVAPPTEKLYPNSFPRVYLPIDGVNTCPDPVSLEAILFRDILVDNIVRMDFNRGEVTRQLMVIDMFFSKRVFAQPGASVDEIVEAAKAGDSKYKIEDVALEAIFSQLLDLETTANLPMVYYHSLLIEACVVAPQDIAPVLGRGLRFFYANIENMDVEILFRVVDWFSHHVSNFAFIWKWNEWVDVLGLPEDHPQKVLVKELLVKQVRLSYSERVWKAVPDEFKPLVPNPPEVPVFKFEEHEPAANLVDLLGNGGSTAEINDIIAKISEDERHDVLATVVCHLGSRSVTHAATWILKCEDLLRENTNSEQIVSSVFDYWKEAPWVAGLVISQFINYDLVKPRDVVGYICGRSNLLLSSFGFEFISLYPDLPEEFEFQIEGEHAEFWKAGLAKAFKRTNRLQIERYEAEMAKERAHQEAAKQEADKKAALEAQQSAGMPAEQAAQQPTEATQPAETTETAEQPVKLEQPAEPTQETSEIKPEPEAQMVEPKQEIQE